MRKEIFGAIFAVVLLVVVTLPTIPTNANITMSIEEAATLADDTLSGQVGIAGISYSENPAKITVYIESDEYASLVPDHIAGYETDIDVSGRIYALGYVDQESETQLDESPEEVPLFLSRKAHWSFMLGGISFGNAYGTGTLGVVTNINRLVTNAHVIALDSNANFLPTGTSTRVYQPGKADSGYVNVGYLSRYITIRFNSESTPNYADAAYATLTHGIGLQKKILNSNNVNWYTVSLTTVTPSVDQMVRKSGRTTGVTENTVHSSSSSANVYYTATKWAHFHDVIYVHQPFSQGGDSGSFVDKNGNFVGLVFAGNSEYSMICKGSYVKSGLGIS